MEICYKSVSTIMTQIALYSFFVGSFWSDGQKICGFEFGEFSFIARNIENLVFQPAECGFKGRRTRLVAKCKPEKQRASELAK